MIETKEELKKLIDVAAGRVPADTVIKNSKIVDVYQGKIIEGDIAICGGFIAGVGTYEGENVIDAKGMYAAPGLIDAHIHIESAFVSPEEIGRLLVPHGATTIIADPHEIVNVCGVDGLYYMIESGKRTILDIKYMLPSCVPATAFESSGAIVDAAAMEEPIKDDQILGLGEYMNFPGLIGTADSDLEKIMVAKKAGKLVDGHCPQITGNELNAYAASLVNTDHECSTVEEMEERIACGLYVILRQGSACHDLRKLLKGLTPMNSRRCLLCSDDRQPKTIFEFGHMDNHLAICIEEGVDPVTAIRMATLNAAECFNLLDRGAIAPGLRADIVLFEDLKDFHVSKVWIEGELASENGKYTLPIERYDISNVLGKFNVKDFSIDKLKLHLSSSHVHVIDIQTGGVVTGKGIVDITLDQDGDFVYDPEADIVKIAVVERHHNTGNVAVALIRGYGIKAGALAVSVAHDSHNIIVVGTSDEDMAFAVGKLIEQNGGVILVKDGEVLESMPLPIAGLMSDQSGEWVDAKLQSIHEIAYEQLGVHESVEPVMTLCFMSLPVIPELKITDKGLFDVTKFDFTTIEADEA